MRNLLAVARVEIKRVFVSPLAWAILAAVQFILALAFIKLLGVFSMNPGVLSEEVGVADWYTFNVLTTASVVLLLVVPLMTMRTFAEERKSGAITLLFSAPVSLWDIVLGKFLGLLGFFVVLTLVLGLMPLSLLAGTDLDLGRIAAGHVGLFLMMMAFGAAGLFMSTITREPVIAAVGGELLLLTVWLIELFAQREDWIGTTLAQLSLIGHYEAFLRGVFNTADLCYYLLFTALFLWASVQRLDMERN